MYASRLTQKYQTTIPLGIRNLLEVHDHEVIIRKVSPLDLEFAGLPGPSMVRFKIFTLDERLNLKLLDTLNQKDQTKASEVLRVS
jgi:bifunctional DNA-binding transcriptional regulator/antitoxin component of YhaV-PrlF toxin-antitoxin module